MPTSPVSDVIVIGGGFGGLYAARTASRHGLDVTLIDAQGHQTFQPLLYQVATGQLPVDVVDYPLRTRRGHKAMTATVDSLDLAAGSVTTSDGATYTAKALVLASGATVNFFGIPGAAEHALPLYTDRDAMAIKARIQHLVEAQRHFDIVVVGAGATGVEIAGALSDLIRFVLPRTYPEFNGESVTISMVDRASAPLAHMSEASQRYAAKVLAEAGVRFCAGASVAAVTAEGVTMADGSQLAAGIVIWAGGLTARTPSIAPTPATQHDGRITIDDTLRIPGHPNVFCIGDCSADATNPLPQLGAVAKQQGIHVGASLHRLHTGQTVEPFTYRDRGVMAMLRHDAAVVEAGKHHTEITGFAAYTMWLGLHAALLPDDRDRLETVHDWLHEASTGRSHFLAD